MKGVNHRLYVLVLLLILPILSAKSQSKITPPPEGKAVVYFIRTAGAGAWINFRFFDKGQFLGKFNGINFLRYECDPGKTVLWVKAENIDFIEADLKEGGIYFVETIPIPGAFSSGVRFKLVDYKDTKQMKRINHALEKKDGVNFTAEEITESQQEMQDVINKSMRTLQVKRKKKKKIKYLTPEMTQPPQ